MSTETDNIAPLPAAAIDQPTSATGSSPALPSPAAGSGDATPQRSLPARVRGALPFTLPIVALVLGIKLLVFSFGAVVVETMSGYTFGDFGDRFTFWNRWDVSNYLELATNGYTTTGRPANYIVFFPGYPFLVRAFNWLVPGDVLTAAFVVSGIASIAAALLLAYLVRHDSKGDEARATRAVWFFLIFPTAYFLHLPYTESLFIAFVLGSFVAARTGHWALAGAIGMLAAVTRLNGVLLLPALMVEAYLVYRRTGTFDRRFLWIGLVSVGLLVYLGINQQVWGSPFHFQEVQEAVWHKQYDHPWVSVPNMLGGLGGFTGGARQMMVQEFVFLAIGLVATIAAFIWTRPSYGVWAFLNLFLFASTGWIQSTPRYVLTIFPIFILLAMIEKRAWLTMLITAWSLMMMAWFTANFANGGWAF